MTCACAQPITAAEVIQPPKFYPRLYTDSFWHFVYHCPKCGRVKEKFMPEREWSRDVMAMEYPEAAV